MATDITQPITPTRVVLIVMGIISMAQIHIPTTATLIPIDQIGILIKITAIKIIGISPTIIR